MKLLILTQKVDKNDPILGFFHLWLIEFAKKYEKITVICLFEREHSLPSNVRLLSLGKEGGRSLFKYIFRFYKYVIYERKNYDSVFVHMNEEYVLLGGLIWKILGKGVYLWRNHLRGNLLTSLAIAVADKVFCTSNEAYTARFQKTKIMPVGIDTNFFKADPSIRRKENSILFLGRIDPVKNVEIFVEALKELKHKGVDFSATIAGETSNNHREYEKMIREKVVLYKLDEKVKFTGPVSKEGVLKLYREHELYVNLTPTGSLDKTIFEALAAGQRVLVANAFFKDILPASSIVLNLQDRSLLVSALINNLNKSKEDSVSEQKNITSFLENHTLENLMQKLSLEMTKE